jgi:hypothetical protein
MRWHRRAWHWFPRKRDPKLCHGHAIVSSREYQLKLAGSIDENVSSLPAPRFARTGIALDPAEFARVLQAANRVATAVRKC